jgi:hypothetical protein
MAASTFLDKSSSPDERALEEALGAAYPRWAEIRSHLGAEYGQPVEEWKFYGQKSGWTMKSLLKKRNLFFFTPGQDCFRISFVFGDRAVAMIEKSGLPETLIEEVKNAKKYAEGRGLRIEVKTKRDVDHVKRLIAIKVTG